MESSTVVRERLDPCERRRKRKEQYVHTTRMKRKKGDADESLFPGPQRKRGARDRTGKHTIRRG
jgi:hypothetical protein